MADQKVTASILFSDVKGYSKLQNDADKIALLRFLREQVELHILTPGASLYSNTWGDGYVICCNDPQDAAEIALEMRDAVRNKDWKRARFQDDFALRVGLHLASIQLMTNSDGTPDIVGVGVDTAARIEPVAEPNSVYCSETFYKVLMEQKPRNIKTVPLGTRQLAKNYGEMVLYQLLWSHEMPVQEATPSNSALTSSIPMPKSSQQFSDKQRITFLRESFAEIKAYFRRALAALAAHEPGMESDYQEITNFKVIYTVFRNGRALSKCMIWLGNEMHAEGISYSQGLTISENSSSINTSVAVEDNGQELQLKITFGDMFNLKLDTVRQSTSAEKIAEALWMRFIRPLESSR